MLLRVVGFWLPLLLFLIQENGGEARRLDRLAAGDRRLKLGDQHPAIASVRHLSGGATQASCGKLFLRIFLPNYGVEGDSKATKGGVGTRVRRFLSALFGGKKKPSPKAVTSHLGKSYKPGDLNYRVQKELKEFMENPPHNCKVSVGKSLRVWIVTIKGAEGTVYEGEVFKLRISFPADYPSKPPSVYFLQPPPRHVHVYSNGDICLSLLGNDWKPNLTVSSLALSILSMLSSVKEKRLPQDNAGHANAKPGQEQSQWLYHDDLS
ncbi:unnamed protein product [Chrysoparadoxa australica]